MLLTVLSTTHHVYLIEAELNLVALIVVEGDVDARTSVLQMTLNLVLHVRVIWLILSILYQRFAGIFVLQNNLTLIYGKILVGQPNDRRHKT